MEKLKSTLTATEKEVVKSVVLGTGNHAPEKIDDDEYEELFGEVLGAEMQAMKRQPLTARQREILQEEVKHYKGGVEGLAKNLHCHPDHIKAALGDKEAIKGLITSTIDNMQFICEVIDRYKKYAPALESFDKIATKEDITAWLEQVDKMVGKDIDDPLRQAATSLTRLNEAQYPTFLACMEEYRKDPLLLSSVYFDKVSGADLRHQITPDLKFEILLQESDLRPNQREKFMNAVTEVLKTKNLDFSDIRLKDIVNIFKSDLYDSGVLTKLNIEKFEDFLSENGFKVKGGREEAYVYAGSDDGRFVMCDYPDIKGSYLRVYDIKKNQAVSSRDERIKSFTLDTPLDKFLDEAEIKVNRSVYYQNLIQAFNHWKDFPGGPIKNLSELKVRDLEGVPTEKVFHSWAGYMHKNYQAVKDLLDKSGAGIGLTTLKFSDGRAQNVDSIKVIGMFPEMKNDKAVHYEDELSDDVGNRVDTQHIVSDPKMLDTVHRYILAKIGEEPAQAFAARVGNSSQKSFSIEQKDSIGQYIDICRLTDISDRESFAFLVRQGQIRLERSVPDKWVDDAASELKDIYNGIERQMATQMKR